MTSSFSANPSVRRQFDLTGRVVLLTGGAGFLGVQFAEALAEMGSTPVLLDLDNEALEKAADSVRGQFGHCEIAVADITDASALRRAVEGIVDRHGRLDVLINNAALTRYSTGVDPDAFFAPYVETEPSVWEAGLKVNLTGVALACQIVGPHMIRQGKGAIINLGSDVGVVSPDHRIYEADEAGYPGQDFNTPAFYAVTKAGVIHLTKYLATLWARHNVRVNALSPAGVFRNHDPAFVKKLSTCIPLGRMATINEYKGAVVFLASDASSFVTGHNLVVDGGRTAW